MATDDAARARLLRRFLRIVQAGTLGAGAASIAHCGARSDLLDTGENGLVIVGAGGSAGHASGATASAGGGSHVTSGAGGFGGSGGGFASSTGQGGATGATSSLVASTSTDSSSSVGQGGMVTCGDGGNTGVYHCFQNPATQPCADPSPDAINQSYFVELCMLGEKVESVFCGPIPTGDTCCYVLEFAPGPGCYVGRAFLVDEGLVKAALREGGGWEFDLRPNTDSLSPETKRALESGWVLDALFEHASVASFARFAMQLLALGAPASLVREAYAAGSDEIRHAEICFGLASAYGDRVLGPGELPIPAALPMNPTLEEVLAESVVEGCIGETLAAAQASEALLHARDPAVIAALEQTLEDEIRHAELSWRFVAWAIDREGDRARRAVARAFRDFTPPPMPKRALEDVDLHAFAAHGRLTPEGARRSALEAIATIVAPCACALLERGAGAPVRAPADAPLVEVHA